MNEISSYAGHLVEVAKPSPKAPHANSKAKSHCKKVGFAMPLESIQILKLDKTFTRRASKVVHVHPESVNSL